MRNQTDWLPFERLHQPIFSTIEPYERHEVNLSKASLSGLLLFVVVFFILILVSTYVKTCVQCRRAIVSPEAGKEPPVAPYWFPYLGHTLSLLWDMNNLFSSVLYV